MANANDRDRAGDPHDMNRFVQAQEGAYEQALSEIRSGRKQSHWMWYIFPQFEGLGFSSMSQRYSIKSLAEARAYLAHPVLGPRLLECADAVLGVEGRSAFAIFGSPDDMKLRSCATLFACVSPAGSVFERLLDRYFHGERDGATLRLLGIAVSRSPARRQRFTALIAAVVLLSAVPLGAGAEQSRARMYRVGWLSATSRASDPGIPDEFRDSLRQLGWTEGQNIALVYRFADGNIDRLPELAAELVRMNLDVIVATTPAVLAAVTSATKSIPVVMVYGPDPVDAGIVASLARPGGNITGLTSLSADLGLKQLELIKEILPGISRVGLLWNPANPWHASAVKRIEIAARALGLRLQVIGVRRPDDLDGALAAMSRDRTGAVLGLADPMTFTHRARLAELAAKHRLPTINALAAYTEAGGLASYWPDSAEMFRRAAGYVHKILNGARPGDLPIEQPTTFELVINLKTARALGVAIPPSLLIRADRVIE